MNETIENTLVRLEEELKNICDKMVAYEKKTYAISNYTSMIHDRVEYDKLAGEKRNTEWCMNVIRLETK